MTPVAIAVVFVFLGAGVPFPSSDVGEGVEEAEALVKLGVDAGDAAVLLVSVTELESADEVIDADENVDTLEDNVEDVADPRQSVIAYCAV